MRAILIRYVSLSESKRSRSRHDAVMIVVVQEVPDDAHWRVSRKRPIPVGPTVRQLTTVRAANVYGRALPKGDLDVIDQDVGHYPISANLRGFLPVNPSHDK